MMGAVPMASTFAMPPLVVLGAAPGWPGTAAAVAGAATESGQRHGGRRHGGGEVGAGGGMAGGGRSACRGLFTLHGGCSGLFVLRASRKHDERSGCKGRIL